MTRLLLACLAAALVAAGTPARAGADFEAALAGTIGTLPVRMRLARLGGDLTGEYVYETKRPALVTVESRLTLSGRVDGSGRFELSETVVEGGAEKRTGTIRGVVSVSGDSVRIEGTWTRPDGGGALPVRLATPAATPAGLRVVTRRFESSDARLAGAVDVSYPRLEGDAARAGRFNSEVEAHVGEAVRRFEEFAAEGIADGTPVDRFALDVDYEVTLLSDSFASVAFTTFTDFGGAHPTGGVTGLTVDLSRGGRVDLADLFADRAGYRRALAARAAPLVARAPRFAELLEIAPEEVDEWYATPRGLVLVFPVPHVAGDAVEVYIPAADVRPQLSPQGARLFAD